MADTGPVATDHGEIELDHTSEHHATGASSGISGKVHKPKKADYRQRAHCNPLSDNIDEYPATPDHVDWAVHFPKVFGRPEDSQPLSLNTSQFPLRYSGAPVNEKLNGRAGPAVKFLDVGCGYGGLLVALGLKFPDTLMLGLEIREQVTNFVGQKIQALRSGAEGEPSHHNVSIVRTNAMKFLVNYIRRGQLQKMFFCFPDPHFKRKNWRRRIINDGLLSIYAYMMADGALLYHATDVKDLHEWMYRCCMEHPLFEAVDPETLADDPCYIAIGTETEEAHRVKNLGRFGHDVYKGVFRRLPNPDG